MGDPLEKWLIHPKIVPEAQGILFGEQSIANDSTNVNG